MKFTELNLHPQLLSNIEAQKFSECTPIQSASMPDIFEGRDVAGLAQTGTGKTAAFAIPLIDRILKSNEDLPEEQKNRKFADWKDGNFVLILVPTRELAEQVQQNVKKFCEGSDLSTVAVYGGTAYEPQKKAINRGSQFVIATPGRLIDLFKEHIVDLNQVRAVVFDEADRMFDMGFKDDMKFVLRRIPKDRQFLVFSATLNFDVLNVAYEFGANPVEVNVSKDQAKAENVEDQIFHVGHTDKPQYLLSLLKKTDPKQAIIFSNFKSNVDRIAKFLTSNGVPAVGISSLLTQSQRTRVMDQFKSAESNRNILVATDVAARGLDIKGVDLVVNFELPDDPENYVHRIGRTGRAGAKGIAQSLVSDRDVDALARIETYLEHKVDAGWIDDADLISDMEAFPAEKPRFSKPQRNSRPQRGDSRGGQSRGQSRGSSRGPKRESSDSNKGPRREGSDSNKRSDQRRPNRKHHSKKSDDQKVEEGAERKERSARPERSARTEKSGRPEHRDRRRGRHKSKNRDDKNTESTNKRDGKSQEGSQTRSKNKPHKKYQKKKTYNKKRYDSKNRRPAAKKPQTVGKKVASFLKKLFN